MPTILSFFCGSFFGFLLRTAFYLLQSRHKKRIVVKRKSHRGTKSDRESKWDVYQRFVKYMTKTDPPPYLKNLPEDDVVHAIHTNRQYFVIALREQGTSYPSFVKQARVEYSKELFRNNTTLTVQQLGIASGFGCQSSYTRSFKECDPQGLTPKQWCEAYLNGRVN